LGLDEFKFNKETNLNPKYRFDCFIVGPHNELAHAAAAAAAEKPGQTYNPLFIYGGVGLGKPTSCKQSATKSPAISPKKIRYVPTEKLTTEIINAIRGGTIQELRAKYLDTAVFIVDDIQFISGKDKTQDEFFYLFNTLYNKNLQIVLSSDRPPKAITELSDRLRSRFEGGMIADISLPDFETRMAILKEKCQVMKIDLSDEILSAIAGTIQNNVRELEGALTKIAAHFKLKKEPPTPETCREILAAINPKKVIGFKKSSRKPPPFMKSKKRHYFRFAEKRNRRSAASGNVSFKKRD